MINETHPGGGPWRISWRKKGLGHGRGSVQADAHWQHPGQQHQALRAELPASPGHHGYRLRSLGGIARFHVILRVVVVFGDFPTVLICRLEHLEEKM